MLLCLDVKCFSFHGTVSVQELMMMCVCAHRCLQGEVITVIRRVDENWAEGKLGDRIGIFPLAFVELNSVARALMKLSTK
jgi:hypothetical protein